MTIRTNRARASVLVLAVAIAIGAFLAAGTTATAKDTALPRNGTLYTSGTAWGPFTDFNPLRSGYATGVLGLLYETLFRYDPLKDKFIPWLATSGRWAGTTYVVNVRRGVTWNDGKPLTAADVKYTFETGKLDGLRDLDDVEDGPPARHDGGQHRPLPSSRERRTTRTGTSGCTRSRSSRSTSGRATARPRSRPATRTRSRSMVGTGPFKYAAGKGSSQTLQWDRRNGWWATKALGMKMPMAHIVDIHNTQNTASLQNFLQDKIDLSNNFFPGVDKRDRRERPARTTRRRRTCSRRTRPGSSRTRRRSRSTTGVFRRALATVDQHRPDRQGRLRQHRLEGEPDRPAADWSKWIDQAAGQAARLHLQHGTGEAAPRAGRLPGHERRRVRREQGRLRDQPADHRPERLVGLDDGDPDHRRQRQGRRDPDHAGLPRLQRPRRRAELRQVRPRHQQREADREHAVHLLRLPLPAADRGEADVRELLAVHAGGGEAVGADPQAQQDEVHGASRRRGRSTRRSRR